jgi:hypothetical protein
VKVCEQRLLDTGSKTSAHRNQWWRPETSLKLQTSYQEKQGIETYKTLPTPSSQLLPHVAENSLVSLSSSSTPSLDSSPLFLYLLFVLLKLALDSYEVQARLNLASCNSSASVYQVQRLQVVP